jgi:hypothetical protein
MLQQPQDRDVLAAAPVVEDQPRDIYMPANNIIYIPSYMYMSHMWGHLRVVPPQVFKSKRELRSERESHAAALVAIGHLVIK